MPIIIPKALPAYKILSEEKVFVMSKKRAMTQDIRPIEIAVLNLMPTKIETETQLLRLLSNTPLQVNVTLIQTASYKPQNVSEEHMQKFYKTFDEIKERKFDGLIITGAPVETLPYELVAYWSELAEILDYADKKVTSAIYICWGAQAALYRYYGINKSGLQKKLFGVYENSAASAYEPLLKGLNDNFNIPHSRHTAIDEKALKSNRDIVVIAEGPECGVSIAKSADDKKFFFFGHAEYDRETLKKEYLRDKNKGLPIERPVNYFVGGNEEKIDMSWTSTANLLFYNWLNYYVYQVTPYNLEDR
jgi:homoserine O-succinyltransferase